MNIVINQKYAYLRDWIEKIPSFFEEGGLIVHNRRNCIKVFSPEGGLEVNVKKFHKPHPLNRIIYTFFRKSKAYRSYHNTIRLAEKGFDTAEAVAFIELRVNGLLSESYFISLHYRDMKEIRACYFGPLTGNEPLIDAFARYSASLHDAGIYHLDYSPGNILIRQDAGQYMFVMVDVNRMKFRPVGFRSGCRNFARLFGDDDIYRHLAVAYSQSREKSADKADAIRLVMRYKNRFLRIKKWKNNLRGHFRSSSISLS